MKRDDLIGCGVVFLFGAVTAALSLQMPLGTLRMAGSGLFPLILGLLLMGLAALYGTALLLAGKGSRPPAEAAAAPAANTRQVVLFLVITAGATLGLQFLGYPLFCLLLTFFLLRLLGVRRPAPLVGLSAFIAAGAYLIFVWFLKIPLPKGWIGL
jgi:hypothetical protein